jgi:ribosome-associated heat shock protein Hsp15
MSERMRLDKWLWAARFFKTRALAAAAIEGGKVEVNGEGVKRARLLQAGDLVRIRLGPYEHHVTVKGLSERRGPAAMAAELYEETAASRAARERLAWQLKHAPALLYDQERGRPTKRDRREIDRLRGR